MSAQRVSLEGDATDVKQAIMAIQLLDVYVSTFSFDFRYLVWQLAQVTNSFS